MTRRQLLRRGSILPVLATAVLANGCGGGSGKPAGTVAGKVTMKGNPVGAGSVNFLSASGTAAMAKIDESGSFKIDGSLDAGDYKVYLLPPVPEPVPPGTKRPPTGKFEVPQKYRDPSTSGLTAQVKEGANDIPIEIGK